MIVEALRLGATKFNVLIGFGLISATTVILRAEATAARTETATFAVILGRRTIIVPPRSSVGRSVVFTGSAEA